MADAAGDLEDIFENAPCGYVVTEPGGRILRVNHTFGSWLGRASEDLVGQRFSDLLNIAGKIYFETHFAPLLRMQGFFNEVALDLAGVDSTVLPVLVNAIECRDEFDVPQSIRITVFNATERRRYEQELLEARRAAEEASAQLRDINATLDARVATAVTERTKAEDALRQAQKMEAVGQLTGGVAHDFNNLLTVILGSLDTIRRQLRSLPPSPVIERMERSVGMAMQGGDRAATLTARLLAFARRQPLDPKPIDAGQLVTSLADLLQRTLGEKVKLETVTGGGLWRALADPNQLESALVNLAVNARDAMADGGRLTIETGNSFLDDDYVGQVPEPVEAGQYVLIAVSDTGSGMTEETLSKVFEPFFTTKSVGKGTGLGLSQVYGFVRQSGGHVRIYSELGEGTVVKIYLPRSTIADSAKESVSAVSDVPHGGTETILVVEDHEDLRAFSTGVLRDLGYEVLEAGDATAALRILDANADVDLLFTDVVLPDAIDGRRLADEVARRRPDVKILFTTGYTRNAIVHNGRLDVGVELLSKPFSFDGLANKVRKILDG